MDTNTIMILVILAALLIAFVVLRGRGSSKARSDFSAPHRPAARVDARSPGCAGCSRRGVRAPGGGRHPS